MADQTTLEQNETPRFFINEAATSQLHSKEIAHRFDDGTTETYQEATTREGKKLLRANNLNTDLNSDEVFVLEDRVSGESYTIYGSGTTAYPYIPTWRGTADEIITRVFLPYAQQLQTDRAVVIHDEVYLIEYSTGEYQKYR